MDSVVKYISGRTGFNSGEIHGVLYELHDTLLHYLYAGNSVKLAGLGTFATKIDINGTIKLVHWPDKKLIRRLNKEGEFIGKIVNKDMIGKDSAALIARWNEEHPDDPIEETSGKGKKDKKK
jgi:hypothetical protein